MRSSNLPILGARQSPAGPVLENSRAVERGFYKDVEIRAVEPDFKKSNKKSDAQGACRRFYPTFA